MHWNGRLRYRVGVVSLFVVFLWAALAAFAVVPMILGWRPVVVTSGSMGPIIGRGDVVVVASGDGTGLGPGTIISFDSGAGLITHRIVNVDGTGAYRTRGDGNVLEDSGVVQPEQVVGVGRLLVPAVGLPIVWASESDWLMVTLWFLVMSCAFWWARWGFLRPIPLLGRHGAIEPWSTPIPAKRPRRAVQEVSIGAGRL